jgi:hypothetical protein
MYSSSPEPRSQGGVKARPSEVSFRLSSRGIDTKNFPILSNLPYTHARLQCGNVV